MKSRKSGLSAREKRIKRSANSIRNKNIDYSDIPALGDEQLASMRRVGRPPFGDSPKLMIALRLDPKLLENIRKLAGKSHKGYQTLIHEILEAYVEKKAA